jgi:hypothetical protein
MCVLRKVTFWKSVDFKKPRWWFKNRTDKKVRKMEIRIYFGRRPYFVDE